MLERWKQRLPHIQINGLGKPMIWMAALSCLYNIVYLYGQVLIKSSAMAYILLIGINLISSVGLYWLCTMVWRLPFKINGKVILPVVVFQAFMLFSTLAIFTPLHDMVYEMDHWLVSLIYQLACALLIVLAQPVQLCMMSGLAQGYLDFSSLIAYMKDRLFHSFRHIWNRYAQILLIVILVDTLIGGVFTVTSGIDASTIWNTIVLYGNPMFSILFVTFFSFSMITSLSGAVISYLAMLLVCSLIYLVIAVNFIHLIGRTWVNHGTSKTKANKKKK